MNTLIVFCMTFVISIICFRITYLYLRHRLIRKIKTALKNELGRDPTDKEISDMAEYMVTGSINSEVPETSKCPPHVWAYDKDGNLICSKCKLIPSVKT